MKRNMLPFIALLKKSSLLFAFLITIGFTANAQGLFTPVASAVSTGGNCYRLTTATVSDRGAVWYNNKIDLNNNFDISYKLNFGNRFSWSGGDGMAFVLQPAGLTQIGISGSAKGYGNFYDGITGSITTPGISPSVVVEYDTYDDNGGTNGLVSLLLNGDHRRIIPANTPVGQVSMGFVNDGLDHTCRVTWNANTKTITAYTDGVQRYSYVLDMAATVFSNQNLVYFGFTAGTGGSFNQQSVCYDATNSIFGSPFTPTLGQIFDACSGNNNGSATINLQGGTKPFIVALNGGSHVFTQSNITSNTVTFSNLPADVYYVRILESNGFENNTLRFTIQDNPAPTITASGSLTLLPGQTVTLSASAANSYLWSNGATTQSIVVGTAQVGVYTVTNNLCTTTSNPTTVSLANVAPYITVPADITINNDPGVCGAIVNFTATETTGYPASTITYSQAPGTPFPVGTTTVTATATNSVGTSIKTFNVTVIDNEKPVFTINTPGTATVTIPAMQTFVGSCQMIPFNFSDPLPAGSVVTAVDLTYSAHDQGWGLTNGPDDLYLDGTHIASSNYQHATLTFNTSFTGAIPGYVYGGNNVFGFVFTCYPGWQGFILGGTMTIHYTSSFGPKTINSDAGKCDATVLLSAPPTSDNCGVATVTNDAPATFPVGTTNVTWTATDTHGNPNTISQAITVVDNQPPVVITKNITVQLLSNGTATITPADINNGSTDNCGITSYSLDKTSFDCSNIGSNTVTLTVTDIHGNSASATANVIVNAGASQATVTATGPTSFCTGGSVTLTASVGDSYLWSTGETTPSITVSTSDSYTVTVSGSSICTTTSVPTVVTVSPFPIVNITAGGPTTFCAGGSVALTVNSGSALTFNGSNRVTVSSTPTLPIGNSPYTIEAWVKPNSVSGANGLIGWGNYGGTSQVNAIRFNGPTTLINYWWNNDLIVTIPNVLDGHWHHIVAAYDGTTRALYMDGILLGSDVPSGHDVPANTTMTIAETWPAGNEFFDGAIDEMRIWNIGKSQSQITVTMNTTVPVNSAGLVAYYKMNEGSGVTTADATNNGNTGTLTGNPVWNVPSTSPVSDNYQSISWSVGSATTNSITVTNSGSYSATGTNAAGCSVTSSPVEVTVNPVTPATITASGPTTFCSGGSVTLTASAGDSYLWSTGETTKSITVSTSGSYTVAVSSASSVCPAVTAPTVVTVNPISTLTITPANPVICSGSSITLTSMITSAVGGLVGTPIVSSLSEGGQTSAKLVVGLRKLVSTYSGPAIRLRRSSDDTESDFGFSGNELDLTAINTFLGGSTGFVTTLYDQSGNGGNITQPAAGIQPTFVANGLNGKPNMHMSSSQYMTNAVNYPSPFTVVYAAKQTGPTRGRMLTTVSNNWLLGWWAGWKGSAYFEGWLTPSGGWVSSNGDNNPYLYTGTSNGSNSSNIYQNGTLLANNAGGITGPNGISLNRSGPYGEPSDGDFTELYIFNSVLSTDDRQLVENSSASYYSIYAPSSTVVGPSLTVNPTTTTPYTINAIDVNGCAVSNNITVTVTKIDDQSVTAAPATICESGSSTVTVGGSQLGINYTLRNNADNSIVAGPIAGTGSAINFNTGMISATTTYNVLAEKPSAQGSLNFNGNNSYVSVPHNDAYNMSSITVEAMVYFNGSSNIGNVIMKGYYGWGIEIRGDGAIEWWNQFSQTAGPNSTAGAVPIGQWTHIAVTVGNGQTKFYVNGVLNSVADEAIINNNNGALYFGTQGECLCNNFDGMIDEIRIWNTVRTEAEIDANKTACLSGTENGLVSLFKFNEGTGTTTADAMGVSNGVLNNFDSETAWSTSNPDITCASASCSLQFTATPTVTVLPAPSKPLAFTVSSSNSCTPNSGIAFADIDLSSGVAPINITWDDGNGFTSHSAGIQNLSPGIYTATVSDFCGTTVVKTVNILQGTTLDRQIQILGSNTLCPGSSVRITTTLDAVSYSWRKWDGIQDVVVGNGQYFDVTTDAEYWVSKTDAAGCETHSLLTRIYPSNPVVLSITAEGYNSCNAHNNGGAGITSLVGGTIPYTVSWTGPNGFTSSLYFINNLEAGTYTVTAQDACGTAVTANVTVVEPAPQPQTMAVSGSTTLCNPESSVTISAYPGAVSYVWHKIVNGVTSSVGGSTNTFNATEVGTYYVSMTDAYGCTQNSDLVGVYAPNPIPLTATATILNPYCSQYQKGTLDFIYSGGTGPVTFNGWSDGVNIISLNTFVSNLEPGTYTASVTDACGVIVTKTVTIVTAPAMTIPTITSSAPYCGNNSVTLTLGANPYSFEWYKYDLITQTFIGTFSPNQSSIVIPSDPDYHYYAVLKDTNNCYGYPNGFSTTAPLPLTFSVVGNPSCGTNTGSANVFNILGGKLPVTYAWSDGASFNSTNAFITNLPAGIYTVTLTDACANVVSQSVTITGAVASATITSTSFNICSGSSALLSITNYNAANTYQWQKDFVDIVGATGSSYSATAQGNYNVRVSNGLCTTNSSGIFISVSSSLAFSINATPSCGGTTAGSAVVQITGGKSPYTYSWTNSVGTIIGTSSFLNSLSAGTYSCTVTDACGIQVSHSVTITQLPAVTGSLTGVQGICTVGGSATLVANTNGTPVSYNWGIVNNNIFTSVATTQSFSTTTPGTYSVSIKDVNGCSTFLNANITALGTPLLLTVTGNNSCGGPSFGSATASYSGTLPITLAWTDGGTFSSTSTFINNLPAGIYTANLTDGCGATVSKSVTISGQVTAGVITSTATSICAGGTAVLSVTNVDPSVTYQWNKSGVTIVGATSTTYAATISGTYQVAASRNGCTTFSSGIFINVQSLNVYNVTANGPVCVTPSTAAFTLSGSQLGIVYTTYLNGVLVKYVGAPTVTYTVNGTGSPISFTSATIQTSGNYTVVATSSLGCTATMSGSANVVVNPKPIPSISASGPTTICLGETVTLSPINASSVPSASYRWNKVDNGVVNNFYAVTETITLSSGGTHQVIITDANGCIAASSPIDVFLTIPRTPTVTADGPTSICPDGSVNLTATDISNQSKNDLKFNGSNYVEAPHQSYTGLTTRLSVEAWFKTDNASITQYIVSKGTNDYTPGQYGLVINAGKVEFHLSMGGQHHAVDATTPIQSGKWYHAVGTWDSTLLKIYVNGVEEAQAVFVGPMTANTEPLEIGRLGLSYAPYNFLGEIDEVRIWNIALSQAQINAQKGTIINFSNYMVANYRFEEGTGTTVADGGFGNPATVYGSPTWTPSTAPFYNYTPTYVWSPGGTTTSTLNVNTAGSYTVTVNAGGCTNTSAPITITTSPVATITASGSLSLLPGQTVTLTASAGNSYLWNNGATSQSIVIGTTQVGTYTVTVTDNNCTTTSVATTVSSAGVTPAITVPADITVNNDPGTCGAIVNFTATETTGVPASTITYSHAPGSLFPVGTTTVTATATNSVGTSIKTFNVIVTDIENPVVTTKNITVQLSNGSATITEADIDNGSTDNCGIASYSLDKTSFNCSNVGTNTVTLTVTDIHGNSASATANVIVNGSGSPATITASGPTTFCSGGSVTLTASAGASYVWNNSSTSSSITVNQSGDFSVTVKDANGCSSLSNITTVTVNPSVTATVMADGPTTFCSGGSVTLTSSSSTGNVWSNGATTASIVVTQTGNYTVKVTNSTGCNATSTPVSVTVNQPATATITASGSTTFCSGGSITLTSSASAGNNWSTGANTASISVNSSGNYSVTITDANGCVSTSTATAVTVNPTPVATITASGPTTFCAGVSVTLTSASNSGNSWSNGANGQSIVVTTSGNYTVTVTNGNGCSATSASISVTVNANPVVTISANGPTNFCPGGLVILTSSISTGNSWSNGATTASITVAQSNSYLVSNTNANGCTASSNTISVTASDKIAPVPDVPSLSALTILPGDVIVPPSATDNCAGKIIATTGNQIVGLNPGTYTINWTYTDNSLNSISQQQTITVRDNTPPTLKTMPAIVKNNDLGVCGAVVTYTLPVAKDNVSTNTISVSEGGGDGTITFDTKLSSNVTGVDFVAANEFQDIIHGHGANLNVRVEVFNPLDNSWTLIKTIQTGIVDYHLGGTSINFPAITQVSKIRFVADQYVGAAFHLYDLAINLSSISLVQRGGLSSGSTFPIGVTINKFDAIDVAGNVASSSFTVTILDRELPVLTGFAGSTKNAAGNCAWNGSASTITISDNCPIPLLLTEQYFDQYGNRFYNGQSTVAQGSIVLANRNFPTGVNTAILTVTDAAGNVSQVATFNITVLDVTPPTIVASGNINQKTDAGGCGAFVSVPVPSVSDNCTIKSVVNSFNGGPGASGRYPTGTTVVTWTVTDMSGNQATTSQTITIVDQELPTIYNIPQNINQTNDAGSCSAMVTWDAVKASDNCGLASFVADHNSGESFPLGTTTVNFTAIDRYNNRSTKSFTITVTDNEAPRVITRPVTVTLVNGAASITPAAINNGSYDNCGAVTLSASKTNFTCADVGVNNVTLNVTDAFNNTSSAIVPVTVIGEVPASTIVVTPNSTLYTGGVPTDLYLGYGATAVSIADNVTGVTPITYSWTGSTGLSCTTCAVPTFTPTVPGYSTFNVVATNKYGCTTANTVSICVRDIRVPNGGGKVYVCDKDPKTGASTTLSLTTAQVANQLAQNPDDKLGPCGMAACNVAAAASTGSFVSSFSKEDAVETIAGLTAKVSPNPTNHVFRIVVSSPRNTPVQIRLMSEAGKVHETRNNVVLGTKVEMGENLQSGVYFAEVIQGNERVVLKLIKLNR